jgi:hypothetical protein
MDQHPACGRFLAGPRILDLVTGRIGQLCGRLWRPGSAEADGMLRIELPGGLSVLRRPEQLADAANLIAFPRRPAMAAVDRMDAWIEAFED